jgi:hypothetical protein
MTQPEVEALFGPPSTTIRNFRGELEMLYPDLSVVFDDSGVADVSLEPSVEVILGGQQILNSKQGRDALFARSNVRYRGNGSINFMDIGVASSDDENLPFPLAVFARGRMDPLLAKYKYEKL